MAKLHSNKSQPSDHATQLALHVHNSLDFPDHGNHLGSTAGCVIDICFDLLTGQTISHCLYAASTQDQIIGYELLEMIQKNDLVLQNMDDFVISKRSTEPLSHFCHSSGISG